MNKGLAGFVAFALVLTFGGLIVLIALAKQPKPQEARQEPPRVNPAPVIELPKPSAKFTPKAEPPKPIEPADEYDDILSILEQNLAGVTYSRRAANAPGFVATSPDKKFAIIVASDNPKRTQESILQEEGQHLSTTVWKRYAIVGDKEFIDIISKALNVTVKEPPPRIMEPTTDVSALITKLRSQFTPEKISAAKELQALGSKAKDARRELCKLAMSPRPSVSSAAMNALKAIDPSLHAPVKILLVDSDQMNHQEAFLRFSEMKEQAAPAGPILAGYINSAPITGRSALDESSMAYQAAVVFRKCCTDSENTDSVIRLVEKFRGTDVGKVCTSHLGDLAYQHANDRKKIFAVLNESLKANRVSVETIKAIGKCGSEAKPAIPRLQHLYERDPDYSVRKAAGDALKAIQ